MTRRRYLGLSAGAILVPARLGAEGEAQEAVDAFMKKFDVPGLSIAIAKDGSFVRRESFGLANLEKEEDLSAAHRFRIASVSKPITLSAIFVLVERGTLGLDDLVF